MEFQEKDSLLMQVWKHLLLMHFECIFEHYLVKDLNPKSLIFKYIVQNISSHF